MSSKNTGLASNLRTLSRKQLEAEKKRLIMRLQETKLKGGSQKKTATKYERAINKNLIEIERELQTRPSELLSAKSVGHLRNIPVDRLGVKQAEIEHEALSQEI